MNVTEAIVEVLKREGVDFIVGYPVNPIIEEAARRDIRTVVVRQERTGLHMADAFSRLNSGERFGVFVMQYGPGAENAFGGVAQAYGESVPILVMPAGYPRDVAEVDPNFSSALNFKHVAKISERVLTAQSIGGVMRRAVAALRNGRPRPVVIEVPVDVFREELSGELQYEPPPATKYSPAADDVERAARALAEAERPVIYAGQGVHYAKAWPELRELAELLNAPVTTSLEGKSAFPENHPLSLGSGGRSLPEPVHRFIQESDVIFGIGCSFGGTLFGIQFPAGKTYIHATLDPADIGKDIHPAHALVGDAKLTLRAIIDSLKSNPGKRAASREQDVPARIAEIRDAWMQGWRPKLESNETPLSPYRVINELIAAVDPANHIITHDAGSPRDQITPFWPSIEPLRYIGWGKTTQLGYGLGLAMGAKLAHPEKLCINVWGDAAIGFTGMDFETAVRERLPILSILLNNFSMAIELPIMQAATEKYRSTDISGNYADMAKAFGGYGERITEPSEIAGAIRRGIKQTENGVPALLEFITAKDIEYSMFR